MWLTIVCKNALFPHCAGGRDLLPDQYSDWCFSFSMNFNAALPHRVRLWHGPPPPDTGPRSWLARERTAADWLRVAGTQEDARACTWEHIAVLSVLIGLPQLIVEGKVWSTFPSLPLLCLELCTSRFIFVLMAHPRNGFPAAPSLSADVGRRRWLYTGREWQTNKTKPFPLICSSLRQPAAWSKILTEEDTQMLLEGANCQTQPWKDAESRPIKNFIYCISHTVDAFLFINSYRFMAEFNLFLCFCFHIIAACCSIISRANIWKIRIFFQLTWRHRLQNVSVALLKCLGFLYIR